MSDVQVPDRSSPRRSQTPSTGWRQDEGAGKPRCECEVSNCRYLGVLCPVNHYGYGGVRCSHAQPFSWLSQQVNMELNVHRNPKAYYIRDGEKGEKGVMEVGEEGDYIPIATLSPPE